MDLGQTLQIDQGLTADDRVIENPPDSLMNGDKVRLDNTGENGATPAVAAENAHETAL